MKTNEIVTVYVAFADKEGGKRRPILVVQDRNDRIDFFSITSKYKNKSKKMQQVYFPIKNWKQSGLNKPSWIDVGVLRAIPKENTEIKYTKVGILTNEDSQKLIDFIRNLQKN